MIARIQTIDAYDRVFDLAVRWSTEGLSSSEFDRIGGLATLVARRTGISRGDVIEAALADVAGSRRI